MKKSIEEMIRSGCTYEEAMDALQDAWDSAVTEREYVTKEAEARQNLLKDYEKYLTIVYPDITQKQLEENVAELETTLDNIRDVFYRLNKIKELHQKSKEQNEEKIKDPYDWVEEILTKLEAKKKDAETAFKADEPKSKKAENTDLDDFLRKMGW